MVKRILSVIVILGVVGFLLLQLIPVDRTNPAVVREVNWDSPQTRDLAKRACFDCHSNETVWPWYSNIAPVKFGLSRHVSEGRERMNFSDWDQPQEAEEAIEVIERGVMPLWDYLLMHPEAKLTADEKTQLINGLRATFQQDPPKEGGREGRGEGD